MSHTITMMGGGILENCKARKVRIITPISAPTIQRLGRVEISSMSFVRNKVEPAINPTTAAFIPSSER